MKKKTDAKTMIDPLALRQTINEQQQPSSRLLGMIQAKDSDMTESEPEDLTVEEALLF